MAGVNACMAFLIVSGGVALYGFVVAAILAAGNDEEEGKK